MKKLNPFAKASILYFISTLIGQGFSFLAIIVFTRVMSKESYGLYSTYYAYVAICAVLVGANLFEATNNAYIDIKDNIFEFRKSVLFLSSLICLSISLLVLLARGLFFQQIAVPLILFAIAHAYSFFVVNFRMYSANMENDRRTKSLLLILPNTLQFFFALALVLLFRENTFYARVVGSTLGVLSCALVAYLEIFSHKGALVNAEYWRYALKISVPTIAMSISYMLMQQCDKVMITEMCGEEFTAVYSVLYYLSYALIVVNQAIGAVRLAWVYRMLDKKDTGKFPILQKWFLSVILVMVIGTFMIAPEAIRILVPEGYWDYAYVAPFVFSAAVMVMYGFYSDIALFHKRNTIFSMCVVIAAVINLVLNAIFIRQYGAIAAAFTTAVAYLVLFILLWMLFGRAGKANYRLRSFLIFLLIVSFMCGLYLLTMHRPGIRYSAFVTALVSLGIYFYRGRVEWLQLVVENKKGTEE